MNMIICPVCHEKLFKKNNAFVCNNRHSFDIAAQGYVNLKLSSSAHTGDNKAMIKARSEFLNKDYYHFLKLRLKELIDKRSSLVDLACGEGYYTKDFLNPCKIGIDLSKEGLKVAARKDKSSQYILASIFQNPLADECTDTVLICFAPIPKEEVRRILKKDGLFVLVKPGREHLYELKEAIYAEPYYNEVEETTMPGLCKVDEIVIEAKHTLNNQEIKDLFTMTPYYLKTSRQDAEKLEAIERLDIHFQFIIEVFKK